jgi:hypothetical protein
MILEDQYKQALNEIEEKKAHLSQVRPTSAKMKQDGNKVKLLENQLDKCLVKYNNLQAENRTLRQQIDVMRKEQKNQTRVNKGYAHELKFTSDKAKKLHSTTFKGQKNFEDTNNHILALKAKAETEKYNFEEQIQILQKKLKLKDDTEMEKTKHRGIGNVANELSTQPSEGFANPVEILRERLKKWISSNKEKKNLMDMYIRNVNIIEDAFNQIKQQTGISSTEEIVTTFIKAEEQNYSLYNYVNSLNSEIDMIEESNRNIEADIKRHEELGNMTQNEKEALKQQLKEELEFNEKQMKEKDLQITTIEQ